MRAATFTDHRRRIGRTVSHVDGHLDDDLDVKQLADMACFSPFHFLRVFQDLTQETPLAMVRRLRLERSRLRLAEGSSVTDAAHEARFESPQAFARAFRSLFGMIPSRVTKDEIRISPVEAPPEIVMLPPRRAISLDFAGTHLDLTEGFGHLLGLALPLMRQYGSCVASISADDPLPDADKPYECRMLVIMREDALSQTRLPVRAIDGGLHAVWRRRGSLIEARADYARLIGHTLPALGHRKTDAPIMRLFHNDPALVTRGNRKWSFFIPLAPLAS